MSPSIDLDRRPRRVRGSAYRDIAEEGGLVVLPGKAEVKVLNPVGSRVFALLDGDHTVADIIRAITEEFEVDEARATTDVEEFLVDLARNGMLAGTEPVTEDSSA